MSRSGLALAALAVALPAAARAQAADSALVAAVRAATSRYRDVQAAIEAGYRKVGPDFPSMGEHWVNPDLVMRDSLVPETPSVLEYAAIRGRRELVGVAWAAIVADTLPAGRWFVPAGAWHSHAGTVAQESYALGHSGEEMPHEMAGHGPRIMIAHAWVWARNPAGVFETDNWALPFERQGIVPAAAPSPDAGRGMSLAHGGLGYFTTLLTVAGGADSGETARLAVVLQHAGNTARALVANDTSISRTQLDSLARIWRRAWDEIKREASPAVARNLHRLDPRPEEM